MKILGTFFLLFFCFNITAQTKSIALKFIPQTSLKIGSQNPHLGGQFDLVGGIVVENKYFVGLGGGYSTNMGMGGKTFPLFADAHFYFSTNKKILFPSTDDLNNLLLEMQLGMLINQNPPYKTGFIMAFGFAYRFDFLKIKKFQVPAFYLGPNIEYNSTKFEDEYRGYKIKDGQLKHIMLNIKIAFDINPINI